MDAFQVTSLILLSIITIALIAWLVIGYKSIIRRDEAAKSLQTSIESVHPRLVEIEAALKGHLPALERATGESAKQLMEVAGLLRTSNQTQLDSLSQLRGVTELSGSGNESAKKMLTQIEELNALVRQLKASSGEGVLATNALNQAASQKLAAVAQELSELRKELNEVTRF
jgi:methyl-accepting chemotaxis protein